MPSSSDTPDRHSGKLLPALLWAGVGVAPLAALALVVGSGEGSLRVAVGLALLAVVLIGLSIALRPTVESVKADLQDTLYDEVDVVREGVRNDIASAARTTHRSFGEKFEQLRGQLEAVRAEVARQGNGPAPHSPTGAGLGGPPRTTGSVPPGVVRHTETVQVTTRSTIVDPHAEESPPARGPAWSGADGGHRRSGENVYGSRPEPAQSHPAQSHPARPQPAQSYSAQSYSAPSYSEPPHEESWTEQQLRKRFADAEPAPSDSGTPDDADRWSGLRSGDRWASVRADERGRELRMGERRTSMHSDESGAEVRFEDRWATIRRDSRDSSADDRRWPPEAGLGLPRDAARADDRGGYGASHHESGRDSRNGRGDDRDWNAREGGWENRQRALPSASEEPPASDFFKNWSNDSAPEPERRRRRRSADDY
jgi:hypothetical protein